MGYSAYVGSFNIDSSVTAGNDQSVEGVGFQPKVVLFWWSGSTATSDSVSGGTFSYGFGVAISSSSRWNIVNVSEDGQATSDAGGGLFNTECIRIYTAADPTLASPRRAQIPHPRTHTLLRSPHRASFGARRTARGLRFVCSPSLCAADVLVVPNFFLRIRLNE